MRKSGSRGAAIINALVIAVTLAAISTTLLSRVMVVVERSSDARAVDQASLLLTAAIILVRRVVALNAQIEGTTHSGQPWAAPRIGESIGSGTASWQIEDLQAKFNLNWLTAVESAEPLFRSFERLARGQGVPAAIVDRVRQALSPESGGRDTIFVQGTRPPVLPFISVGQLRLIAGMIDPYFDALSPLVASLPAESSLNVNTVLPEIVAAFIGDVDLDLLERELARARPFPSVDSFHDWISRTFGDGASAALEVLPLDVSSAWFGARVNVQLEGLVLSRYVILNRIAAEGRVSIYLSLPAFVE